MREYVSGRGRAITPYVLCVRAVLSFVLRLSSILHGIFMRVFSCVFFSILYHVPRCLPFRVSYDNDLLCVYLPCIFEYVVSPSVFPLVSSPIFVGFWWALVSRPFRFYKVLPYLADVSVGIGEKNETTENILRAGHTNQQGGRRKTEDATMMQEAEAQEGEEVTKRGCRRQDAGGDSGPTFWFLASVLALASLLDN